MSDTWLLDLVLAIAGILVSSTSVAILVYVWKGSPAKCGENCSSPPTMDNRGAADPFEAD